MKHYECVRQDGTKDCGIASLLTIVKTYGGSVSKEYLRTLTRTGKNGVNAYYLLEAGKTLGFMVQGVEADFRTFSNQNLPCIAHITVNESYQHFVVIHAIQKEKEYLVVADPAVGIRTISFAEFDRLSTGKYLLFTLTKPLLQQQKSPSTKKIINLTLKKHYKLLILIFIFSFIYLFLELLTSFAFQLFLEEGMIGSIKQNLLLAFVTFLGFTFFLEVFQYLRRVFVFYLSNHIDFVLFKQLIEHLFSLPYLYFKNRPTGEVLARLSDRQQLQEGITQFFLSFCFDAFAFLLLFIFLSWFLNSFLWVLIIGFALFVFISYYLFRPLKEKIAIWTKERGMHFSMLTESLRGISSLQHLDLTTSHSHSLIYAYRKILGEQNILQKDLSRLFVFREFVQKILLLIYLYWGGLQVVQGTLSFGRFFVCYTFIHYFIDHFSNLLYFFENYQSMKIVIDRLDELFQCPSQESLFEVGTSIKKWEQGISIRNLSYSYIPHHFVIRNFSLEIKPGMRLLIYGESGSGKSTLAKLLLRYFEVAPHTIYIDNTDICDFNLLQLRQQISYLSQEEFLFTDSVYQNIVLYRDISYDDFLKVARLVRLDFIKDKSSLGYHYLLEEDGFNLSGGERQRILLARALLKEAQLYIFDESFSEIDVPTERKILKDLFHTYPNKTFLIISHRLSNQDLYDRKICFPKEGVRRAI